MILVIPNHHQWYTYPSLAVGYLYAVLERAGLPVDLVDGQVEPDCLRAVLERRHGHRWIGITMNVVTTAETRILCQQIRAVAPDLKIALGGPQAAVLADSLVPEYADCVVVGEGEQVVLDLLSGRPLTDIPGIIWWDGEVMRNPAQNPVRDLDSLPFPAWHRMQLDRYQFLHFRRSPAILITHRGCPYQCLNCTKSVHGSNYRTRSIENVMEELDYLHQAFAIEETHIWDDNFTLEPERVKRLCEAILHRNLHMRFALLNGIRADIDDPEMYRLMQRAGFYWVSVAIESGVQTIVQQLGKRLDLERVLPTLHVIRQAGIRMTGYFMIGLPFDTPDTVRRTIDFACRLPLDSVMFFMTLPFPGTGLYDLVVQEGRFLKNPLDGYTSYDHGRAVFEMPGRWTAREMDRLFRTAYRRFYLRPGPVLQRLRQRHIYSRRALAYHLQQASKIILKGRRL